jgi:hypothetical protein
MKVAGLAILFALAIGCAPTISQRTALSVEANSSPRIWVHRDYIRSVGAPGAAGTGAHAGASSGDVVVERELLVCFMAEKPGNATCYPTDIKENGQP